MRLFYRSFFFIIEMGRLVFNFLCKMRHSETLIQYVIFLNLFIEDTEDSGEQKADDGDSGEKTDDASNDDESTEAEPTKADSKEDDDETDSKEADKADDKDDDDNDKDDDKDDSKQDDDQSSEAVDEPAAIKKRAASESREITAKSYPVDDLLLVCMRNFHLGNGNKIAIWFFYLYRKPKFLKIFEIAATSMKFFI